MYPSLIEEGYMQLLTIVALYLRLVFAQYFTPGFPSIVQNPWAIMLMLCIYGMWFVPSCMIFVSH